MLVLKKNRTVKSWPVECCLPIDGGKVETFKCTADFNLLTQTEWLDISTKDRGDDKIIKRCLVGWSGIATEENSNTELPFSQKNIDILLDIPPVRAGILNALMDAQVGAGEKKSY